MEDLCCGWTWSETRRRWKRRYVFANVGAVLKPTPYEIISSLLEGWGWRCAELRPHVGKIAARLQELLEKLIIFPVS